MVSRKGRSRAGISRDERRIVIGEWNPYKPDEFEWEILKVYLKHGYGMAKLYETTFFKCSYNDETVCMCLEEFAEKAVDIEGVRWFEKERALKQMGE